MELLKLVNTHFNPFGDKQIEDGGRLSYTLLLSGVTLVTTGAIACRLFGAEAKKAGIVTASAGACFLASYMTGKSGYAFLPFAAFAAALGYSIPRIMCEPA